MFASFSHALSASFDASGPNDRLEGDAWAAAQPQASPAAEAAAAAAQASVVGVGAGVGRMVFVDAYSGGALLTGGQVRLLVFLL